MPDVGLSMPRPRRRHLIPAPLFVAKRFRPCCLRAREEDPLGRFPVGFCGPGCLGRDMRREWGRAHVRG